MAHSFRELRSKMALEDHGHWHPRAFRTELPAADGRVARQVRSPLDHDHPRQSWV